MEFQLIRKTQKMKNLKIIFLVAFLISGCQQHAQIIIESQPIKIDFKNPYKFKAKIEEKLNGKDPMGSFQAFLDYSILGDFEEAQKLDDIERQMVPKPSYTKKQIDSVNSLYKIVNAKDYILNRAKENKIIIINEAHHNPRHRFFTKTLLKELRDLGYTHLGLEALYNGPKGGTPVGKARIRDEKDSNLNSRKYPARISGTYIQEPQFGNLVREALALGFEVFAYEKAGVGSGHPREIGQAKNILKVLRENPNAKVLIHCGFAHAYEGAYKAWGKAMAAHLKELSGIDPLTINQVEYSEHSKPEFNEPLYNALNIKESSVLIDEKGKAMKFVEHNAFTDIAVFHPSTTYQDHKPDWLFQNGVHDVKLDLSMLDIDSDTMILAFKKGEIIDEAIPIDIAEINKNSKNVNLALKKGQYTIVVSTISGDAFKYEITVK